MFVEELDLITPPQQQAEVVVGGDKPLQPDAVRKEDGQWRALLDDPLKNASCRASRFLSAMFVVWIE
jgi:hypothetical protein